MALAVKNPPTNTGDIDTVGSLGQGDPPEEGMAIHSSILAGEPRGRGAWWAAIHRVTKSWGKLEQKWK